MKAYKGFDKNMQCCGFQYAEGQTYEEEDARLCESGFHACTMPLDVLGYYAPARGSIYREVELEGGLQRRPRGDSKVCARKIRIGAELGIAGLVKAQIEWVKETSGFDENIKKAKSATGCQGAASATGRQGAASATGDHGAASATGRQGAASATGRQGAALAAGIDGRVMGALGCALFAVERADRGEILSVAAAIVDGENIKPDTWYTCRDGKLVEVER
jgi:hypothetical protein